MRQSSLFPGLFFHLYNSAQVTRFPVKNRIVSSAERQKLSHGWTKTPSTSKIKMSGVGSSRLRLRKVGKVPRSRTQKCRFPHFHRQVFARTNTFRAQHLVTPSHLICSTDASALIFTCRFFTHASSASSNSCGRIGFVRYPSIPAARHFSRSPFIACAVNAITVTCS